MNKINFFKSQRGTAMIEFALLAPVLIFLVIGIIEVGRYVYFGVLAAHAAEAGAQYGAQNLTNATNLTGMSSAATADAGNLGWTVTAQTLCSSGGSTPSSPCPSGTPGSGVIYYVKVNVSGTFHSLLNYPGIPTAAPVGASTIMRVISQ